MMNILSKQFSKGQPNNLTQTKTIRNYNQYLSHFMNNRKHLFGLCILLGLIAMTTALHTSSYWAKRGFNVKDQKLDQVYSGAINVTTQCNTVDLNIDPYHYNGTVRSGYLSVGKGSSALGFIFYGRQNTPQADLTKYPIVFWLNGGPGSSSQLGNFFELGPFHVRPANLAPYEVVRNNHSWTKDYSVVFVDQPVGTGISYADQTVKDVYCTSMECVANDFYAALKELYQNPSGCFNQLGLKPDQPFVVFGQSYGGKYAPAIGQKILREQHNNKGFLTGLKGVAIGDGFTNPGAIFSQVGEFAYNLGLLDYQERTVIEQLILNGTFQQRRHLWRDFHDTFDTGLDLIVNLAGGVNVYDITKYHEYPDLIIAEYLGNPDNQKLYGLRNDIVYAAQSGNVYQAMYEDFMMPYVHLVEEILRMNTDVMVYNGQNDLIVETPGTFKWAERVHYDMSHKFRETLFETWKVDNRTAGYRKQVGLYELRTVNNAGHLVPMDQGAAARQMLKQFVVRSVTDIQAEEENKKERIVRHHEGNVVVNE